MRKRKITKANLAELAKRMPVLSEKVQAALRGGGDGSRETPFSYWEYKDLGELFKTGWVDLPDSISYLTHPYDYYFGGSGSDAGSGSWGDSGFTGDSGDIPNSVINWWKPSCVFYCLDYFDGDEHNWTYYSQKYIESGGVVGDNGAVPSEHLSTIAGFGGFNIQQLPISLLTIDRINADGSIDGCPVMMTYPLGDINHAVVVKGWKYNEDGDKDLIYFDPSNGIWGTKSFGNFSDLFIICR